MHLLLLDVLILFLQLLLETLTYEKSLQQSSSITVSEVLLPYPLVPPPLPPSNEDERPKPSRNERIYIVDVRLAPLINRIRQSAPEVERPLDVLPLPNTSNLPTIPRHFRALMSIREERRRPSPPEPYPTASDRREVAETEQRLPGSMGMEDTE